MYTEWLHFCVARRQQERRRRERERERERSEGEAVSMAVAVGIGGDDDTDHDRTEGGAERRRMEKGERNDEIGDHDDVRPSHGRGRRRR